MEIEAADFYKELDTLFLSISVVLSRLNKSIIIADFFFQVFSSFVYANLISNFFDNLNDKMASELDLDSRKIPFIMNEFANIRFETKISVSEGKPDKRIDHSYYEKFRNALKENFPDYLRILLELERLLKVNDLEIYLEKKNEELKKLGKPIDDYVTMAQTKGLELFIQKTKKVSLRDLSPEAIFGDLELMQEALKAIHKEVFEQERKRLMNKVSENRRDLVGFEDRLYERWHEPLDLLEMMIQLSVDLGEKQKRRLGKDKEFITNVKHVALLKIHARSILIAREILVLLKAGYVDGAHARWRSLHEIAVISFFLQDNEELVSERYLNHTYIRRAEELKDYQYYCDRTGYSKYSNEELKAYDTVSNNLVKKYGIDYDYSQGYGWIPKSILKDRNFKKLEKSTKMDHLRPYYNWSSNQVHGGSHAFEYLGVPEDDRDKILFIGPSNYGLTDPLHSAALSVMHITMNFLSLDKYPEFSLDLGLLGIFADQIGATALEITQRFEKN